MNIAILSRGPQLYSTRSLARACIKNGHKLSIIDHTKCSLFFEKGKSFIHYEGQRLRNFDVVIPRIGASVTEHGAAIINGFELMNTYTTVRAEALLLTRNKLRSLMKLAAAGIAVPRTILLHSVQDLPTLTKKLGGYPIVIKLQEGTHGVGVILAEHTHQAISTIEAFHRLGGKVVLQEYVKEAKGQDVRVLVVGGEIVAAMQRQAPPQENFAPTCTKAPLLQKSF